MFSKSISVFAIAAVMATGPATKASADAGDFVAGALIGGVVGHALTKENQRKKATTQRSTTRTYNTLPSTQEGREIQASLNYFGFDAGAVDGQLGRKSRNAVSNYQGYLGYPVTGVLSPFEQNLLISSYNRAQAGGYATNQQAAALPDGTRGLLRVYRDEMAGGGTTTASVPEPAPTGTLAAVAEPAPSAPALPSFMNDGAPQKSLAAHCNQVSLLTNSNGGFTTEAKMTDANFALNEQFCLARTYAIAEGQELAAKVSGYTTQEITQQSRARTSVHRDESRHQQLPQCLRSHQKAHADGGNHGGNSPHRGRRPGCDRQASSSVPVYHLHTDPGLNVTFGVL